MKRMSFIIEISIVNGLLNKEKVDIGDIKVDIQNAKVDIQRFDILPQYIEI